MTKGLDFRDISQWFEPWLAYITVNEAREQCKYINLVNVIMFSQPWNKKERDYMEPLLIKLIMLINSWSPIGINELYI